MRTALFALTEGGAHLVRRLAEAVEGGGTIYLPERLRGSVSAAHDIVYFARLADVIKTAFTRYDAMICVMATGIVVRMLASCVESKLYDPAVLVFDEAGRHGISLLSGHIGGANELTRKLCAAVGADPVITTATDVTGALAPDVLAARLALRPVPKSAIQVLNTALLAGKEIAYYIAHDLPHAPFYEAQLRAEEIQARLFHGSVPSVGADEYRVVIIRTEDVPNEMEPRTLYLVPRRLIAGVGCRAGVPEAKILRALTEACGMIGREPSAIDLFASTTVKRSEAGLLAAAATLGREIRFYPNEDLTAMIERYGLTESDFVRQTIGVGNVSEAAALCAAGEAGGRMALGKTAFEKVTVALLWEK